MTNYSLEGNSLAVSGELANELLDEFVDRGLALLDIPVPQVILDIRQTSQADSAFLGAIAQLGAEARTRAKTLVVRAQGRTADVLVWAGLHRIVTLYISNSQAHVDA
jgi:anti-anti-sigma regulatory factor